jgi:hypothetical protein
MLELKNPRIAVPVVLFAGILWSFGPLVVRYMDNPNSGSLAIYFWKRTNDFYYTQFISLL